MIEIKAGSEDNIITAVAHGTVTDEDYKTKFIPAIEEKLKKYSKIRFLYHLGEDFSGYTLTAIWDDAKLGVEHLTKFEKVAIVTDVHWVSEAGRFFGLFIPCPVKVFGNDKLPDAKDWLNAARKGH